MATCSKCHLNFIAEFHQCEEGIITLNQLAGAVLDELARWARLTGCEEDARDIEVLWSRFDLIADDLMVKTDELDDALKELYNWVNAPVFDKEGNQVRNIMCRIRSSPRT